VFEQAVLNQDIITYSKPHLTKEAKGKNPCHLSFNRMRVPSGGHCNIKRRKSMKRFFKNSFFIALILVSFVGSGIQVKPAYAQQEGMQIEPLNLPNGWSYGFLYGIWGSSADNVYAVGYGYNGSALRPLLYHKTGNNWTDVNLSLPSGWNSGNLYSIWGSGPNDVVCCRDGYG
jgi:hypothetical protein